MAPREAFAREMGILKNQIEEMSRMVQATYKDLQDAILANDTMTMVSIIRSDKNFYDMKKKIEAQCLKLITKQQPIATDLRLISSVLKIVTDIERVGDHAGDISELAVRNELRSFSTYYVHLEGMFGAALELFANAVEAYVKADTKVSYQVIKDDDIIDELFNKVKADVIEGLKNEINKADIYIDMMMLAKYLEKVGDHAVNIAKWEIYKEEGNLL